jgi:flagellar biosynthesis chaperone FliJ
MPDEKLHLQAEANLAERIRKLESVNASLQQRCTQLQHLVRAKERAAQKLQDKLEEGVLKVRTCSAPLGIPDVMLRWPRPG